LLAGGKRRIDETIILCTLFDGRSFTAECSQLTAAKFTQIANFNLMSKASSVRTFEVDRIQPQSNTLDDTIECPMCAEFIKSKAKICRYCGYKVAEEKEARLVKVAADTDTDHILFLSDLYQKYIDGVEYEDFFSEAEVRLILNAFVKIRTDKKDEAYRSVVDLVKKSLELQYKTQLLDLFRVGFSFARTNKKFKFIDEDGIIIISKSDW